MIRSAIDDGRSMPPNSHPFEGLVSPYPSAMSRDPRQPTDRCSECVTHGVRVRVQPQYRPDQSDPAASRWVFAYRIRITNETSDRTIRLLRRRWEIVDADGECRVVEGAGVVGQTPILRPGEVFEYTSYCPLETPWGTMEGVFRFAWRAGNDPMQLAATAHATFEVDDDPRTPPERDVSVARFYLVADDPRRSSSASAQASFEQN